jgi:hypothetical protein
MDYGMTDLKEAVKRLEDAVESKDPEDVDMYVRLIRNISTQIKNEFWATHMEDKSIVIQPTRNEDKNYRTINTLEFLYKPMHFSNIYEGNEIEYFSKERTEELVESGAIDAHNEFWQTHEIIYGNVYGSVPSELISKDMFSKLIRCGWKKVSVDIIEYKNLESDKQMRSVAEKKYRHYILLKENETKSTLLLRYNF